MELPHTGTTSDPSDCAQHSTSGHLLAAGLMTAHWVSARRSSGGEGRTGSNAQGRTQPGREAGGCWALLSQPSRTGGSSCPCVPAVLAAVPPWLTSLAAGLVDEAPSASEQGSSAAGAACEEPRLDKRSQHVPRDYTEGCASCRDTAG